MIKLIESGVVFNQEEHTYSLDNKILHGITGMISRQLFPNKYMGVSQSVLNKAAAHGSMVHEQVELYDAGIIDSAINDELKSYIDIKGKNHLITLANEYIVTDREYFASGIDIVSTNGIGIVLTDIKTTYKLDIDYVRWQLSIYAYLFELQTGLAVCELRALWLRGSKSEYVLIDRISNDIVQSLLDSEVNEQQFVNPFMPIISTEYPIEMVQAEMAIAELENDLKGLKENKEAIMSGLLTLMKENSIKSYKGKLISLSRKSASVRISIDGSYLKEKHPDIYEECKRESSVKESITLKIN